MVAEHRGARARAIPKIRQVALLIETSRAYGRGILQGIIRYHRAHGPWSISFEPQGLDAPPPRWLKNWQGDGILARIDNPQMARAIRQTGLPAVDMRFALPRAGFPGVGIDNRVVVELAFEHLSSCGFKHYAFCGLPGGHNPWMDLRCCLFKRLVVNSGHPCHVFQGPRRPRPASWEEEQEHLVAWVLQLPKPVGIMACNDDRGQQVLDACRRVNIFVPDEVAVLGVDNDEFLCNLSSPPLSSVDINTEQVGYEAAALLDRIMAGKSAPTRPLYLPPRGVAARESTDVLATEDRELAAAIRLIREHACEGLRLKDFARETRLSRRALERGLRKLLGRSPKEEITRVQLEKAKQLLVETDLSAAAIAKQCGYSQPKYFSQVFHARVGLAPSLYRRDQKRFRAL